MRNVATRDVANEPFYRQSLDGKRLLGKLHVYWPESLKSQFEAPWEYARSGHHGGWPDSPLAVDVRSTVESSLSLSNMVPGQKYVLGGETPHALPPKLASSLPTCANNRRLLCTLTSQRELKRTEKVDLPDFDESGEFLRAYATEAHLSLGDRVRILKAAALLEALESDYAQRDVSGIDDPVSVPLLGPSARRQFNRIFAEIRQLLAPCIESERAGE